MLAQAGAVRDLINRDSAASRKTWLEWVMWQAMEDDRFLVLPHPEAQILLRSLRR